MTTKTDTHDWDGCLMCAVRALTEGRPQTWGLRAKGEADPTPGSSVSGVVMRMGEQASHFESKVPYVDLWLGGIERVRVAGHSISLREAIISAELQVGDSVTFTYEGEVQFQPKNGGPSSFRKFSATVERGHH